MVFKNLDKMNDFSKKYILPKSPQMELENLSIQQLLKKL